MPSSFPPVDPIPAVSAEQALQVELNSAHPDAIQLLKLLENRESRLEDIIAEIRDVLRRNKELIRYHVVPASGLPIVFYVARRLSKFANPSEEQAEEAVRLFDVLFTEGGAEPNCTDAVMRQNVLFYAAKAGCLKCCKYLVSKGCSSDLVDIHSQSALFYAAREGKSAVVEWLVKEGGCDINHVDRNGQSALFYAAREDRLECVMLMVNSLGADPLIRDIYKKRARGYLKSASQKRTYDYLTEVERHRDPSTQISHRKLFVVRNEPLGAAAMTLRQHKPYNPYQKEEEEEEPVVMAPQVKRQRSGTTTPAASSKPVKEKSESVSRASRSERSSPVPSPLQSPVEVNLPIGRARFRVRAPLGQGGLEAFEKEFPQFALWGNNQSPSGSTQPPTPPKTLNRPARAPPVGITPPWVNVASLLLRGPLWRYGPAMIFHKPVLQLPANLGAKYQEEVVGEKKLSIDLSVVRKKLEKRKYVKMTELDKDIRSMFEQAYELSGGKETSLGRLTRATEIYYDQQLAGCGLAGIIRQEATEPAHVENKSNGSEPSGMDGIELA